MNPISAFRDLTAPGATHPAAALRPEPVDRATLGEPAEPSTFDLRKAARVLDSMSADGQQAVSVWRVDVGHYDATAVTGPGGQIVEGGLDASFRSLSPGGGVLWTAEAGHNGLSVKPALGPDGSIYVSRVSALEAYGPDGNLRWSKEISDSLDGTCSCGPEGHVYIHDGLRLLAVEGSTGEVLWTKPVDGAWSDHPPVVGADGTVYTLGRNSVVQAWSPDGRERWAWEDLRKDDQTLADVTTRLAVGPEGNVYLGDRTGTLRCLGPDGRQRWSAPVAKHEFTNYESPSVDGQGRVYVGDGRHGEAVVCLDADGQERWRRQVGPILHVTGAPDGGVLAGVKGGHLHRLDGDGVPLWVFRDGTVFTQPAFGPDGTLYTGAGKSLYAVRPGRSLREQAADAVAAGPDAPAGAIAQEGDWILVGEVRLPVQR